MDRTVRIHLHPTSEQREALQETLVQFTQAFNAVCVYGWHHREKNGVKLHHALYYETKAACPGLVSDLLIQARVKATEALKSALTWQKKHEQAYQKKVAKAKSMASLNPPLNLSGCLRASCVLSATMSIPTRLTGTRNRSGSPVVLVG